MQLYLVRHTQPIVVPGLCYGRTDLQADPALLAGALPPLRERLPQEAPVFSSPLQRCTALAHALAPDVCIDPRLVELDFGTWEMMPWDRIARAEIDAWAANVATYPPGGGESVLQMARRISEFYDDLVARNPRCAIIICHAGSMRLLAARHRGLAPTAMAHEAAARPHAISYGEIMVLGGV